MKNNQIHESSLEDFAKDFDIDFQVLMIKSNLIDKIQAICKERKISQRKLALMVPGLTHDRVNKVFNGLVGHMTIDKLLQITYSLKIEVSLSYSDVA